MQRNQFEQVVCEMRPGCGHPAAEGGFGQQGVWQMIGVDAIAIHLTIADHPADTDAGKGHAVITLGATDEASLAGLAFDSPVGPSHFE